MSSKDIPDEKADGKDYDYALLDDEDGHKLQDKLYPSDSKKEMKADKTDEEIDEEDSELIDKVQSYFFGNEGKSIINVYNLIIF